MVTSRIHQDALRVGDTLHDRYQIVGRLGRGGFAEVYLATDARLRRQVALKVLRVETLGAKAAEQVLGRFEQEARLAAQINHRSVVSIHDFGVHQGQPFIVMERLEGHDLRQEIKRHGPMAPKRLWPLMEQALLGLGAAHQAGVVHKDLKPANLFLVHPHTEHEQVRLLDFGVARMVHGDTSLTHTGQIFGTAMYYAPEYIRHQLVTPALDVYQMALILVELLTDRPVVHAEEPLGCVAKHLEQELELPRRLLQGPLGPVLVKALAFDPAQRYPDALALREALLALDPTTLSGGFEAEGWTTLSELSGSHRSVVGTQEGGSLHSSSWSTREWPHPNPAPRTKTPQRWWWVGLVPVLVAILLALALWMVGGLASPVEDTAAVPLVPLRGLAQEGGPPQAEAPGEGQDEVGAQMGPALPGGAWLSSTPPAAQVTLVGTGELLGETPLEIPWEGEAQGVEVRLKKSGYGEREVRLRRADGPLFQIQLTPVPSTKPRRTNPRTWLPPLK